MSYKCYICGKEYSSPVEAANCTLTCHKKLQEQQELRELEISISNMFSDLQELCKEYSTRNNYVEPYVTFHIKNKGAAYNYVQCRQNNFKNNRDNLYQWKDAANDFVRLVKEFSDAEAED